MIGRDGLIQRSSKNKQKPNRPPSRNKKNKVPPISASILPTTTQIEQVATEEFSHCVNQGVDPLDDQLSDVGLVCTPDPPRRIGFIAHV